MANRKKLRKDKEQKRIERKEEQGFDSKTALVGTFAISAQKEEGTANEVGEIAENLAEFD